MPKTWLDFLKVTQFMTEELKSQGIYGTSMVVNPPNFGWGFWMDIAASAGVNYFDEGMNPTINQGKAAEALDMYKEIIKFGPPGAEAMDIGTTIQRWMAGSDVMSVWWIDLAEFTVQQQGLEKAEDQRAAIVPGWKNDDGSHHQPRHFAVVPHRVDPEERAAGRQGRGLLLHLPHVAPGLFRQHRRRCLLRHRSRSARRTTPTTRPSSISKPNPQRGTNDLWTDQRRHLQELRDGARTISMPASTNVKVGYPQFFWEGAPEYADALGRNISKAIAGELTSQQALDEAAEEWVKIVQKLGIDKQKAQYKNFIDGARTLGYKI